MLSYNARNIGVSIDIYSANLWMVLSLSLLDWILLVDSTSASVTLIRVPTVACSIMKRMNSWKAGEHWVSIG